MKNLQTKLNKGLLLLGVVAFLGVLVLPTTQVKTAFAAPITLSCNSATIEGDVVVNGATTTVWFEWGPGSSLSNSTTHQTFSSNAVFRATISGLNENSPYSYRAMASNQNGTSTGQTLTFTTPLCNTGTTRPTVNLTADDTSIPFNGFTIIRWTSNNATSCTASGGTNGWSGSRSLSGSFNTGSLTNSTTYNITCSNNTGSADDSVTVAVGGSQSEDPTVSITADDTNIDDGDNTVIRWDSDNADTCTASGGTNGWSGSRSLSGSFNTGSLTSTKTYSITCYNDSGSANDSVTVRVNDNNDEDINVTIDADDTDIDEGDSTVIRWDSDNADDCRASGGTNGWSGDRSVSGSFRTGSLHSDTTYRIRCTNDNGDSDDDSVTVRVDDNNNSGICRDFSAINYLGSLPCRYNQVNNGPTVIISADSTNLSYNGATTIRWSTTNATSCNASGGSVGWAGPKSIGPASFYTGSLTSTKTYSITCYNNVGSATDFAVVGVRGQVLGVTTKNTPSSLVLVTTSVDRNRPIVPTLDNTNPCPGDEINYTITYQNIGNASIKNLVLRVDLPYEVTYMSATPTSPMLSGQTLIFNLGTLGANKSGTVTVKSRVRDDVSAGAPLNFPAVLSYTDPSGFSQSVSANVSANVCGLAEKGGISLGASVFGAGFLPTSILGWLILIILILLLILLAKYIFGQSFQRRTVTTYNPTNGQSTTTTL